VRTILFLFSIVVLAVPAVVSAQAVLPADTSDAKAIAHAVYRNASQGARTGRLKLTIDDGSGKIRERTLKLEAKGDKQALKSLLMVEEPADTRGTGFLNIEPALGQKGDAERWLYLAAIKRVTRVAGDQLSASFLGSDFSFADLGQAVPDVFNFRLVKQEEAVDGESCWVIEATPKERAVQNELGYSAAQLWVSKTKLTYVRIRMDTTKAGRTKYFQASDLRKVDNRWTPHKVVARTVENGKLRSSSTLTTIELNAVPDVADSEFTKYRLERGP
jgi:hypothetical protein